MTLDPNEDPYTPGTSWNENLTRIQREVHALKRRALHPKDHRQVLEWLRKINGQLWGLINGIEDEWHATALDLDRLVQDQRYDEAKTWRELADAGVLRVTWPALKRWAKQVGIDPEEYLTLDEEE